MAKKNGNHKFWIYGEDEKMVAQFTQYMNVVLENCRIRYIDQLKRHLDHEESYDELQEKINCPVSIGLLRNRWKLGLCGAQSKITCRFLHRANAKR